MFGDKEVDDDDDDDDDSDDNDDNDDDTKRSTIQHTHTYVSK